MQRILRTKHHCFKTYFQRTPNVCIQKNQFSTVDIHDVEHHSKLAADWWNPNGPVAPLHSLNGIRVPFIRDGLHATGRTNKDNINTGKPLENVRILEVGCGAGILTEQLARLHGNVVAIDPSDELIKTARNHVLSYPNDELFQRIEYHTETIESHNMRIDHPNYDAVVVSEVLEHVDDKESFLKACTAPLLPGGSIFITTFNRTNISWIGGILFAEHILSLVPKGTHDWNKFIPPLETQRLLERCGCLTVLCNGFQYEFWKKKWVWTNHNKLSYALQAIKS